MASNLDNAEKVKADPRLLNSGMDLYTTYAQNAADRLNQYGKVMSASERSAYEKLYADSVKGAQSTAADLGIKYKAPEVIGAAATDGKVTGVGTATLTSSAQDLFATVDGYGKTLDQNLTQIGNSVKNNILAAKDWLFNTEIPGLGSLSEIQKKTTDTMASINELGNQLNDAIGKPISQVKGMSDDLMNSAMTQLDRLNELSSGPMTTIGGVQIPGIIGAKIPAVNSLIDTYNNTKRGIESTYSRVRDMPAELAMRLALIDQGGKWGLSDFINHLIDNDDQDHDQEYHVALIDQFDYALSSGNLDIVDQMLTKLGAVTVLNRYPDAVSRILRSYRFPVGTSISGYPACREHLIRTLQSLDDRWLYNKKIVGKDVISMSIFVGCSDAIAQAFATDKYYNRLVQAVRHFNQYANGSLVNVARQFYPYSAIAPA